MDEASVVMIVAGAVIILTRGVLLIAPGPIRVQYLRSLLEPMVVIYTTQKDVGAAAQIMHGFAWFIAVMCAVVLIPFPGPVARMGKAIWGRFSPPILRAMGALSVAVGGWLVWYGLTV